MANLSYEPIPGPSTDYAGNNNSSQSSTLLYMPEHVLEHVLSYLSYHDISENRRVCKDFNRTCQQLLTHGFTKVDKFHARIQKQVKSKLPRRESERRNHVLSRHVDILSALETRLSLLSMTYSKYIESELCCFIPGKVMDELFRLLRILQQTKGQPPRAHEFLQELRDISSMAMEHFEENIVPWFKQKFPPGVLHFGQQYANSHTDCSSADIVVSPLSTMRVANFPTFRQEIIRLQQQVRAQNSCLQVCKKELTEHKSKLMEQKKLIAEQEKKLQDQANMIGEQDKKMREQAGMLTMHAARLDTLTVRLNNMTNAGLTCNSIELNKSDEDRVRKSTVIEKLVMSSRSSQRIHGKRHRSNLSEEDVANIHKNVKKKKI
ncbi:F-box only protein 28-like [Gigantopelta aegis]|uniref:F-box only protein 28-like n=1 Tax=Gigantopelta aegis TaxID=1735272 RepID=UPI001B88BA58|nr:F-box only protein 28-like [Gigantopelta aegis]